MLRPAQQCRLTLLTDTFAICRLAADVPIPGWALDGDFSSITRTTDELSIVCSGLNIPEEIQADRGWRCLKVDGPLDLSLTGILVALAAPLAEAGVTIFAISTYDTDYLLVRESQIDRATMVLSQAGHTIYQ